MSRARYAELAELGLSVRTLNALVDRMGITTIEELTKVSEVDLRRTRGVGRKTVNEVKYALEMRGLCLGGLVQANRDARLARLETRVAELEAKLAQAEPPKPKPTGPGFNPSNRGAFETLRAVLGRIEGLSINRDGLASFLERELRDYLRGIFAVGWMSHEEALQLRTAGECDDLDELYERALGAWEATYADW